jgi:hypothetical protein
LQSIETREASSLLHLLQEGAGELVAKVPGSRVKPVYAR